jgi:hypothetical protein
MGVQVDVLNVFPFGLVTVKRRYPAYTILTAPDLVREAMFARSRDDIDKAIAIAALCRIDAQRRGLQESVQHFENILQAQHDIRERWAPPLPSKGAPKGPRDYTDDETFMRVIIDIKRLFVKKGVRPTQARVAMYLMELQEEQANILGEQSAKSLQRHHQSVVRRLQRFCEKKRVGWNELM